MRAGLLIALGVLAAAVASDGEVPLAPGAVKPLERVAREIAKAGRGEELDEVLDVLRRAGMESAAHQKLAATCRQDAAKVKKVAASVPSAAKSLQKVAADLAPRLAEVEGEAIGELARLLLRLDSACEPAHRALGREKAGGEWLDAKAKARLERRRAIGAALARARALPIEIDTGPSQSPYFAASKCKTPSFARLGPVTVHGVWGASKLERCLRETIRAVAFANFLLTDKVAVPRLDPEVFHVFEEKPEYENALIIAMDQGKLDDKGYDEAIKLGGKFIADEFVGYKVMESDLEATMFTSCARDAILTADFDDRLVYLQPGVVAGLLNFVALNVLGTRLPVFAVEENQEEKVVFRRTGGITEEQRILREKLLLLSEAGIAGGRAWLAYLAERNEDPPLPAIFVDQTGKLQGNELLKSTFVAAMVAEDGPAYAFLKKLPGDEKQKTPAELFEAACGRSITEFEAGWREWFLPARAGLAQRLGAPAAEDRLSADEHKALAHLNELRRRAGVADPAVEFDRAATAACRKHALYLARHSDQLERWPDAHEEYPDREGFDADGAWAGNHSVIAPGVRDAVEAIDGWMGTFYHRLPLLDPGLVRVGYALERECAILDAGTFVRPREFLSVVTDMGAGADVTWWGVAWPPPGASNVPTRFQDELPDPVPGEDDARMGYPVTLQLHSQYHARPEVELVLHEGGASGKVVPSWFSTPTQPTNPKLAPDHAWCLIPKSPLAAGTSYTVTGTLRIVAETVVSRPLEWSFRCGK